MFSSSHSFAMQQFIVSLENIDRTSKIHLQLLNILKHIHSNQSKFEVGHCQNSPFYKEFVQIIVDKCTDEESCFALLECTILFCREKQLKSIKTQKLSPIVQELLYFYENSEHWHIEDATLLHTWYWHTLPKACNAS